MEQRILDTPEAIHQVKRECTAKVKAYIDLANEKLGLDMPYPLVKYDLKGTTAGTAQFNPRNIKKCEIRFSATLLRENPNHFINDTVGHEVAHLIARLKYGIDIDPHGNEWARIMWAFSLPAVRCHSYDTKNVPNMIGKIRRALPTVKTSDGIVHLNGFGRVIEFD